MTNDLDAIEQEYNKWNGCQECGLDIYIPPLILELREARAEVEAAKSALNASEQWDMRVERDDWRRRYEALRDGVTGLCDIPLADVGRVSVSDLRAVVARVEENNA